MSTPDLERLLRDELVAWDEAGLRRTLEAVDGEDFCTNDYLGLALDPRVSDAAAVAVAEWGVGSRAARLLGGQLPLHEALEHEAAEWLQTEAALLFPSGWQANVGVLSTLARRGDVVFSDRDNHASLIDGARLSRADVRVFDHNDPEDLGRAITGTQSFHRRFIVVESVYSMDGSLAPLEAYQQIAREHDAWLIVDEAHAAGLLGPDGAGLVAELDEADRVAARIVTGGKALGVCGALVAGSRTLVDLLVNRARAFVFTTAPTPPTVAALHAAVREVRADPERRARPLAAARRLRAQLERAGVVSEGEAAITFLPLETPVRATAVAAWVQADGFHVRAVRPPTVPEGRSGLRIVCHADHDNATVDALAERVAKAAQMSITSPRLEREKVTTCVRIVVGTDTGVGKTVLAAVLARAAKRRGGPVVYWKPLQTGAESDTATVRELADLDRSESRRPVVWLEKPASVDQAARAEGVSVDATAVVGAIRSDIEQARGATWIIETAGGVFVPLNDRQDQLEVIRSLSAPAVVVARSGLGTLNHTRLTLEALDRRGVPVKALVLVGRPHPENVRTLATWAPGIPIFELPTFEPLDGDAIDHWLDENDLDGVFA